LVDLIKIKMAQTRSGNRGRGRGRGRTSGGRGGGRTSEVDRRTSPTTPAVHANTSTPQRTTTIPRKNRGPAITTQQTIEPVQPTSTTGTVNTRKSKAGSALTDQSSPGPVTILQATAPEFNPVITILQTPHTQGSFHGSMPGLFPGTPNSTNTGQGPIVPIGTINQLLQADNAKDLFTAIFMELELTPYKELWKKLGINNLETMNDFINRPSTMYNGILGALFHVSPRFPEVPYY
jgi:hypothetical protein